MNELTQAQSAITQGATSAADRSDLVGVGASIESYAKSHGVPVVDYDRLTLGGDRAYYVSFDNVEVGKLIGQGMVVLHNRLEREEPAHSGHARRADRQQCDPLR